MYHRIRTTACLFYIGLSVNYVCIEGLVKVLIHFNVYYLSGSREDVQISCKKEYDIIIALKPLTRFHMLHCRENRLRRHPSEVLLVSFTVFLIFIYNR